MAFWKKKKKEEAKQEPKANAIDPKKKPVSSNYDDSDFNQQHKVINQQTSRYSVNPEMFDYEKVKLNSFLTDSEEYNRKKLVDDLPNADARYLNQSRDQIELKSRLQADEQAFKEIYTTLNNNNKISDFEFTQTKNKSVRNVHNLNDPEKRFPVKTRLVNEEFYQEVGKNLDKNLEKISDETKQFLQNMQTKILDLNNLTEPLINKVDDYTRGGWQTTKKYVVDNTLVNTYDKMLNSSDILNKEKLDDSIITCQDFYNLKSMHATNDRQKECLKKHGGLNSQNTINFNPQTTNNFQQNFTNQLNYNKQQNNFTNQFNNNCTNRFNNQQPSYQQIQQSRQFINNQNMRNNKTLDLSGMKTKPLNITKEFNQVINQELNNLHFDNPEYKEYKRKTKQILDNAQTYDEIVSREIKKEIDEYHDNREISNKNITNLLDQEKKNHQENLKLKYQFEEQEFDNLIPVNEIKMDLRIRKSERRNFIFNDEGHF